jgi:tetratricopeptide (TPR) repeat protein
MPTSPVPPADPRLALARWYNNQMVAWNQSYLQGGEGIYTALRSFDGVSEHVRGLLPWLATRAETDDAAAQIFMRLPLATGVMGLLRYELEERIRWCEAALACARRLGNSFMERAHVECLGSAYIRFGDPARAIGYIQEALDILPSHRPPASRARLLTTLGLAYTDQGDVAGALRTLGEALSISRAEEEADLTAIALIHQGELHNHVGKPRNAIACLEECLRMTTAMKNETFKAEVLNDLGNAWMMLGELDRATPYLQQSVAMYRKLGFGHGIATCLLNLGIAHVERGDAASAVETLEEALRMIGVPPPNQTDRLAVRCKTLNRLGKARGMQGDLNEARRLFGEALEIAEAIQDSGETMTACVGLGYMRLDMGDLNAAEAWFERAITLAKRMYDHPGVASGLYFRAQVLRARGQYAAATESAREALAIYEEMSSPKAAALRTLLEKRSGMSPPARRWQVVWRKLRTWLAAKPDSSPGM